MQQADQGRKETSDGPQRNTERDDPTLGDILGLPPNGRVNTLDGEDSRETQRLLSMIKKNYEKDPLTRSVLASPNDHQKYFRISNELIWTKNF